MTKTIIGCLINIAGTAALLTVVPPGYRLEAGLCLLAVMVGTWLICTDWP